QYICHDLARHYRLLIVHSFPTRRSSDLGASEGQGAHVTTVDPWTLYKPRQDTPEELSVLYGRAETYAVFKQHMDAIGATPDRLTVKRGYAHTIGRKWVGGP